MFKLIFLLSCLALLPACKDIIADELPGASASGDLSAHLSGCDQVGRGLIKCTPNIGTQTAGLVVWVSAPLKKELQCESYSCVHVEIRDGSQVLAQKWIPPEVRDAGFSMWEILGQDETFKAAHSALFGVKVTVYYRLPDHEKDSETVYDGEIRLKPVAAGYRFLSLNDKYTAAAWECFDKYLCGLSTKGRSYLVKK